MATVQQSVFDKLYAKLGDDKTLAPHQIQQLKALLTAEKKPKADDFIKMLTAPPPEDVR